jgi:stage II sporulation protein D
MADEEPDAHGHRVDGTTRAAHGLTRTDGSAGPVGPWPVRRGNVTVGRAHQEELQLPAHRSLRTVALVPTVLGLVGALLGPPAVAADDRTPIVRGTPVETAFYGRGWGHGVGMSQYGARGRALAGQTATEILGHYYQGATPGTKDPATTIRILVLTGFAATAGSPAIVYGRGGTWTIDGIAKTFPADAKLTLATTAAGASTWSLKVVSAAGAKLHGSTVSGSLALRPAAASSLLQLFSKPSSFDTYRGVLRVYLSTTVKVVNELGLDLYLRGVVPAEMPAGWPAEALRAQAIAARSYAARRLRPGESTYDVFDDTRSQVYHGYEGEAAVTNAAIDATSGTVLKSGTSIANTLFHSTGGGATENNENVFVSATGKIVAGPVSYLRGSSDRAPDGSSYDAAAPYATWQTGSYTRDELSAIFGHDTRTSVGAISRLDLSRRGVSGRLISVTLVGATATKTVSGDVFRSVFNSYRPSTDPQLRSTLFDTQPIP